MAVLLRRSCHIPETGWEVWAALPGAARLDMARVVPDLAQKLEEAFDAVAPQWLDLAARLGAEPSAVLAHAPSAAANASDLGLMMAWTKLVEAWGRGEARVLVLCDDPWMFRALAALPGIEAGEAPTLAPTVLRLALRGFAARIRYALTAAKSALSLKRSLGPGGSWLLAYGHPGSEASGADAYFGDLMSRLPVLKRLIHVDAGIGRARALESERCASLHGWGSALFALARLPFARWRPKAETSNPLVRRAAALEGGTAQGAAIAWQIHCQTRWLEAARPQAVAWPWENHGWERALVRRARRLGIRTIGYQHSVVGRQMLNYGAGSNPDGAASLPDHCLCSGPATLAQLQGWGIPADRLALGGALRFAQPGKTRFDADAPAFMALPFDQAAAAEMVEAARQVGRPVLVKDHPMTPFAFEDGGDVRRCAKPLGEIEAVSAVIYAATTVGLEALLLGLPSLRFRPLSHVALDILPAGITAQPTSAVRLAADLASAKPALAPERSGVFAAVDMGLWTDLLCRPGDPA